MSPEQQKILLEFLAVTARTQQALTDLARQIVSADARLTEFEEAVLDCIPPAPERIIGDELLKRVQLTIGEAVSVSTLNRALARLKSLGLVTSSDRKPYGYSRNVSQQAE